MEFNINLSDFKNDYLNNLLNKEQMIRKYYLSDYMYNNIIKKLNLKREYTSKLRRIFVNNEVEIVKIDEELIIVKKDDDIKSKMKEELKQQIKEKLENSKNNRNK
jgi:hypothetical protein